MSLVNLSIYYKWKILNLHTRTIILKYLLQLGMKNLIYLMDHILLETFKIILNTSSKKNETITSNPPVQIYVNIIKNGIVFKIKTDYKLELLSPQTMKLLGNIKKLVDQDKDGESVPKFEPVEIVLVHCNIVNNNYQQVSKVLFTFVPNKQFGQLINIEPHSIAMLKATNTEYSFIEIWLTN